MAGYKHLEIPGNFERYVKDKKQSANAYYRYFLTRLTRMFEYKGLPDTIPHQIMDRYLFINGIALITEVNGKLYCFYGNAGGEQDVYYRPSQFIVSNPHLHTADGKLFSANIPIFEVDAPGPGSGDKSTNSMGQPIDSTSDKGVLLRNDTEWMGLNPLLSRYAYLMAENVLTLRTADVMLRILAMLTAPSDKERAAALEYLRSIEDGKLGVIGESPFFDGVKMQSPPSNNGSYLTQFIELQQYYKGSFFNELGLSANYNMKREAIGTGESTLDTDALLPLCDDMLLCRRQDLQKVNDMYGTHIEVSFSSAWLENEIERKAEIFALGNGSTQQFGDAAFSGPAQPMAADDPNDAEHAEHAGGSTQGGADGADDVDEQEVKVEQEEQVEPAEPAKPAEPAEPAEPDENSESKINDMTWSDDLHELEEKIEDGSTQPVMPVERSEDGSDGLSGDAEATRDDKAEVSD